MATQIEDDYEATVIAAVREAAAEVAFQWSSSQPAEGAAIYRHTSTIATRVMRRLAVHYSHTRKAKTQRKVEV